MPESASAVSQIAEEEHKRGKANENERGKRENVREMAETGKREIRENAAWCKCLKMADVRSQRKTALGTRT